MKNILVISTSASLAPFIHELKKNFTVISVKDEKSGEILSKDFAISVVFSDMDIDPAKFPLSDVILTTEKKGAYFLPELSKTMLSALIKWIEFSNEKTEKIKTENTELQKKIEDISIINRAKCVLMKTLSMTENEAYKYIEKKAMEMRLTKSEIAKRLLATYDN